MKLEAKHLLSLAAAAGQCGDTAIEAYAQIAASSACHNGIPPNEALDYCQSAVDAGRYIWTSHAGFLGGAGSAWSGR